VNLIQKVIQINKITKDEFKEMKEKIVVMNKREVVCNIVSINKKYLKHLLMKKNLKMNKLYHLKILNQI